jgi:Zn-dependent protease with chaperone function
MKRPPAILIVWALFLTVVATVEWTTFTHHTPNYFLLVLLPAFAIAGAVAVAGLAAGRRGHEERPGSVRVLADLSLPSALIGVAMALMLWGSFIGEWLLLIGAGLLVLGLGGLVRELRLARRVRRAAARGGADRAESS